MVSNLENFIYFDVDKITSSMTNMDNLQLQDNKNLSIDMLHEVYGEDIDISVDLIRVCSHYNIKVEENDDLEYDSLVYFNQNNIVIEFKNHKNITKNNVSVATAMGHIFLHMVNNKGAIFFVKASSNFLAHHRAANNMNFNTDIDQMKKDAHIFGCELLVPKGALEYLLHEVATPKQRFLMSDLCDAFKVSNGIMYEVLNIYDLWTPDKIYDNYG